MWEICGEILKKLWNYGKQTMRKGSIIFTYIKEEKETDYEHSDFWNKEKLRQQESRTLLQRTRDQILVYRYERKRLKQRRIQLRLPGSRRLWQTHRHQLQGQRPSGADHLHRRRRQSRENPRKPEHHQSPCCKKRKTGNSRLPARCLEEVELM